MNTDALRQAFRGTVIPAVPVSCDHRGNIERDAQDRYVTWMAQQRIGGVAVWAHTGRGLHLNPDQRLEVLEAWVAGSGHPVMAGVGVPTRETLPTDPRARTDAVIGHATTMATEARDGGAVAVLVHPPAALRELKDAQTRIVAYHDAIGEVLPTMAFYLYDDAGGIAYSDDLVMELVIADHAVGMKFATLDDRERVGRLCGLLGDRDDVLLVTGEDLFLGDSLRMGCTCALIGMAAALTDVFVMLLQTDPASDGFEPLARGVDRYAEVTFGSPVEGYVQRMLWALEDDGVLDGPLHDPLAPELAGTERDAVREAVTQLRTLVG